MTKVTNMLTQQLELFFGFKHFRENQIAIIQNILEKKDSLVIMPTGVGKSLCYQLPAIIQEGIAIVISPLIALMKNQVDALEAKNIKAASLNSSLPKKTITEIKAAARENKLKLIYISPESFNREDNLAFFQTIPISFIAIDEAHCISDWGHDFRPEYRKIKDTIQQLGAPPVIALTATATPKVQQDIIKNLEIEQATVFKSSFERVNFHYQVRSKNQVEKEIIQFIKTNAGQCGIIYCHSRKKVEGLAEFLTRNNITALGYHAGLDAGKRSKIQDDFLANKVDIIVATIAFGMGIDKPDVRFVMHYDTPKSVEGYYQETGRAGRDGKKATCILFYDEQDIKKLEKFSYNKTVTEKKSTSMLLDEMRAYAISSVCRNKQLLYYFGEKSTRSCGRCDNCENPQETYEGKDFITTLLQAIKQTKELLNEKYLVQLICGMKDPYMENVKYDKLPIFGKGEEHLPDIWISVIRQARLLDYIKRDEEDLETLKITEKGKQFMAHATSVKLFKDHTYDLIQDAPKTEELIDNVLLEKLMKLRDEQAKKMGIKPYLVFQEMMLETMATIYPTTLEALAALPGVGISKAHKFGRPFTEFITKYIEEHNIEPVTQIIVKPNPSKFAKTIQLIRQIDKKTGLKELAKNMCMTYEELIRALEKICYAGVQLKLNYYINELLSREDQEYLYDYFYEAEIDNIDRAIEDLGDEFNEDEIRLMHIKFLGEVAH